MRVTILPLLISMLMSASLALPPHIVVVGAGVGGVTVANFYSQDPTVRVLLIEQGPEQCAACDLSIGANPNPSLWNQLSLIPQAQPFLKLIRAPIQTQFTGLGGNSKVYGCVNFWPSRELLDSYPAGFRYDDLLPYLKRNENHYCHYLPESYTGISPTNCTAYHGLGGHFDISPQAHDSWSAQIKDLVAHAKSADGPGWAGDHNNPDTRLGLHEEQAFRRMANRSDPYSARARADAQIAFLNSTVRARPNLQVISGAQVSKLIINPVTKRVVAVRYSVKGAGLVDQLVVPLKRVFVCAGVLGTPQLLHASQVGPADFLAEAGITPLVVNNHIGKTLQSHMALIMAYETNSVVTHDPLLHSYNSLQWQFATGLQPAPFRDDVQVELLEGFYVESVDGPANGLPIPEVFGFLSGQGQFPYLAPEVELHHTLSNGYVRASTPSLADPPTWDLGWGFAPFFGGDLTRLLIAMGRVRQLFMGNNTFANTHIKREVVPGPYYRRQLTDAGLTDADTLAVLGMDLDTAADFFFIQDRLVHFFHLTSTVPLGTATNLRGEVNGVVGVNVCDASLLPQNPDSNPSATIAAVCRKIARDNFAVDFPSRPLPL